MTALIVALLLPFGHAAVAPAIQGHIRSIGGIENLVWIQGLHCPSSGSCEGMIYKDVKVLTSQGEVTIPRLVLLHPETTDCEQFDPHWAVQILFEKFAPMPKGKILDHPYLTIEVGALQALPIHLSITTDKSIGYAAEGPAHIGRLKATVQFEQPFPENRHLASLCKEGVEGTDFIREKTIRYEY